MLYLVVVTAVVLAIPEDKAINENVNVIGTQTEYEIIGIEPGAGLMGQAKTAITDYGLENWTSSGRFFSCYDCRIEKSL